MAAKLKKNPPKSRLPINEEKQLNIKKPALWVTGLYFLLAGIFTFPLLFRMNSSVYGFYDHVSTDLFASLHYYFWWMKESLWVLKSSPFFNPLFAAPFGQHMTFANFTGFVMTPFSMLFGYLFSYNLSILFNLVMSGLGMFLVVRHITKSAAAGMVAGIIYAFCPNMLVRSYTTFDSTQVQWIPFYTLFVLKFLEERTWKNALLAGMFLSFNILFTMPYYLVYLPVHTVVLLAVLAGWRIWGKKRGFKGFLKDIFSPEALRAWLKTGVAFALVVLLFGVYYTKVTGGSSSPIIVKHTTTELANLSLKPLDYFVPHPRSALFKGNFKETYWDKVDRPEKNSDSDVAYIGYAAFFLALAGLFKSRGAMRWFFLAGSAVAFWATMGPTLFGLPTPSRFIYIYAPAAQRILLYKVYVQFGVAGLAGLGTVYILERLKTLRQRIAFLTILTLVMLFEYTLVPPALSVNLTVNPEVYERVKALPATAKIIEVPERRANAKGNLYQGYVYYQTVHGKALFNPYMDVVQLNDIPERIRPFYHQMEVPLEAGEYCNLAALRWLGISHLIYHFYIGTTTVQFASFQAGNLAGGSVEGLKRIYQCNRDPRVGPYPSPFDYTFADLYEISADPCPVALTFDYHSPFGPPSQGDFPTRFGYASALLDSNAAFYFPVEEKHVVNRIMRGKGLVTAVNLSDKPVEFALSFLGSAPESRTIEVQGEKGQILGKFTLGPEPLLYTVTGFSLQGAGKSEFHIIASGSSYNYPLDIGGKTVNLPALATFSDFRVTMKKE